MSNTTIKKTKQFSLTDREKEILSYIGEGYTSSEIGEALNISTRTVDAHRRNLLLKTNARNAAEMVNFALKNGLILI